jgi:hypothetical protein
MEFYAWAEYLQSNAMKIPAFIVKNVLKPVPCRFKFQKIKLFATLNALTVFNVFQVAPEKRP